MTPTRDPRPYTMWCFGLSEHDIACIRQCAGTECVVTAREDSALHDEAAFVREEPTLLWVHADIWLREELGLSGGSVQTVPKVMVLDADKGESDLDRFIEADAEHVLRGPLTASGVYRILRRTLEVCSIHQDMGRMTREILLGREILTRKTDVLTFLIESETHLTGLQQVPDIVAGARKALETMLPIRSMHAALWSEEQGDRKLDLYFEGVAPESEGGEVWKKLLQDAVQRLAPGKQTIRRAERLLAGPALPPGAGHVLLLPLRFHEEPIGALMLLLTRDMPFSRDQSLALNMILSKVACLLRLADVPAARSRSVRMTQRQAVEQDR